MYKFYFPCELSDVLVFSSIFFHKTFNFIVNEDSIHLPHLINR